ncbi:MAG: prephenate dehydrogenase [Coriobacteriales bacterium]|nr:prephenate dehydrogenase [Coriobacteriales bacterium]
MVGVGLIGGSIAAGLRRTDEPPRVLGVDTDRDSLDFAVESGIVDDAATPKAAFDRGWFGPGGADVVILATPAGATVGWFETLGELGYEGIVTDVASTKSSVLSAAERWLPDPSRFVGGHPMAGSERSGVQAARPELFEGAYYVLTPTEHTDVEAYRAVHELISALGARVITVDASSHDRAVAVVSHVPHVAAAALVDVAAANAADNAEVLRLAAGGFKDTTRIAAGSPDLWTGICLDNASALTAGIEELRESLARFAGFVATGDRDGVRSWLAEAADVRRSLPAQWVPATSALSELRVPMLDRPGQVGEITGAVSRAGCNIEGIDIDHVSEDTAVLSLVLTDEGDVDSLIADLTSRGYEPILEPLSESPEATGEEV